MPEKTESAQAPQLAQLPFKIAENYDQSVSNNSVQECLRPEPVHTASEQTQNL
jgi:hypothetical protein